MKAKQTPTLEDKKALCASMSLGDWEACCATLEFFNALQTDLAEAKRIAQQIIALRRGPDVLLMVKKGKGFLAIYRERRARRDGALQACEDVVRKVFGFRVPLSGNLQVPPVTFYGTLELAAAHTGCAWAYRIHWHRVKA